MSLFENISFINEGEQAEEYKARKAREKEEAENKAYDRMERRKFHYGDKYSLKGGNSDNIYEDINRDDKRSEIVKREWRRRKDAGQPIPNMVDRHNMNDALNRHIRRYPDQYKESGIFESVSFINE